MEEGTVRELTERVALLETALSASREECERLQQALLQRNAELRTRANQMKHAEQLARIGYWHSDLRTGQVTWSGGMSSLLGYPAEPQVRAAGDIYDYVSPDDRAAVYRAVAEAAAGTGVYMAEFRAATFQGEEHYVRILGEIELEDGHAVSNFGVAQDITPIKQAEAALKQHEERSRRQAKELEVIYATAPIGLCVLDEQLRFVRVNRRLAEFNGLPVEAHLGRTVGAVVPAIAQIGEATLRRVLESGQPAVDFDMRGETPAQPGIQRSFRSQYWPLMDDAGKVTGINVVVEEMTTQEALAESRRAAQEFRALAENSTDMITRFDRSLRRVYVNPAVAKVFGLPRSEVIGKTNEELGLAEEIIVRWREILGRVFATGQPHEEELEFHARAGDYYLDSHLIPEFGAQGEVQTVLVVTRDITGRKQTENALRESEERYHRQAAEMEAIYQSAPIGLAVLDTQLRFLRVNSRLAQLNGVAQQAHPGLTVRQIVPSLADQSEQLMRRVIETGKPMTDVEFHGETLAEPGAERWWSEQWFPLKDETGRVWGVNVAVEEITGRKRAEETLRRREQEFEALTERSPDVIARYDRGLRLLYVNPAVEQVTGRPRGWYLGKTPREMELPNHVSVLRERILREILESGREQTVEHEYPARTGSRYFQSRLVPERGAGGRVESVLVVDRDITEIRRAQEALEDLTLHDPLTGIANRRYLARFIDREWRREARHRHSVAIVMADIDFFKAYNDHYGHQRGDDCLRQVANTLQANLRRPTDILVRYGGEEFAMVLLESDLAAATRIAEAMHRAVEQRHVPHEASSVAPVVTISLGVTAAPADRIAFKDLLSTADTALYRAKHNGRNRVEAASLPLSP
jgi:diguanylate cyclase (GGDEF)-like protein/PAS domain S-box-containing protein